MSESPRYRCALEKGFFSKPTEIHFAKLGGIGVGQRAEYGDEFDFEDDPGQWMEPINEAARERAGGLVKGGKRKTLSAQTSVSLTPLKPPKASGLRAITETDAFAPPLRAPVVPDNAPRAAPRRRSAKDE